MRFSGILTPKNPRPAQFSAIMPFRSYRLPRRPVIPKRPSFHSEIGQPWGIFSTAAPLRDDGKNAPKHTAFVKIAPPRTAAGQQNF